MAATKPALKMPELLVFARSLVVGFAGAETWRASFYLGTSFAQVMNDVAPWVKAVGILAGLLLCLTYAVKRGAHLVAVRMGRSYQDMQITCATPAPVTGNPDVSWTTYVSRQVFNILGITNVAIDRGGVYAQHAY